MRLIIIMAFLAITILASCTKEPLTAPEFKYKHPVAPDRIPPDSLPPLLLKKN